MTDVPDSIGYMTIKGQLGVGFADSDDAGNKPDMKFGVGTCTLTNNAPTPIVALEENLLLAVASIPCKLDGAGRIVPPTDGEDPASGSQVSPDVEVIAPIQSSLSNVGWSWTATFKPAASQKWAGFVIKNITGEPGDVIDLSAASFIASTSTLSQQPVVWVVYGTVLPATPAVPAGALAGQFIFDHDNQLLYLIGAL